MSDSFPTNVAELSEPASAPGRGPFVPQTAPIVPETAPFVPPAPHIPTEPPPSAPRAPEATYPIPQPTHIPQRPPFIPFIPPRPSFIPFIPPRPPSPLVPHIPTGFPPSGPDESASVPEPTPIHQETHPTFRSDEEEIIQEDIEMRNGANTGFDNVRESDPSQAMDFDDDPVVSSAIFYVEPP